MPLRGWKAVRSWNELLLDPSTRKTDCVPSPRLINSQIFKSSNVPCFNITEPPRGCVFPQSLHVNVSPPTRAVWGLPLCESSFCKEPTPCAPQVLHVACHHGNPSQYQKDSPKNEAIETHIQYSFSSLPVHFSTVAKNPLETCFFFSMAFWMLIFPTKIHPLRPPATLMDQCASYAKQLNPWRLEAQNLQLFQDDSCAFWLFLSFSWQWFVDHHDEKSQYPAKHLVLI